MKLTCDVCGGELQMQAGGRSACCVNCGLQYDKERMMEILNGGATYMEGASSEDETIPEAEWTPVEDNLTAERPESFQMTIEDVFVIAGRGTIVTGQVRGSRICVGGKVTVIKTSGEQKTAKVTAIEHYRKLIKCADPDTAVGILLKGIPEKFIQPGDLLMGM